MKRSRKIRGPRWIHTWPGNVITHVAIVLVITYCIALALHHLTRP